MSASAAGMHTLADVETTAAAAAPRVQRRVALVCDDRGLWGEAVARMLEDDGFEITARFDRLTALAAELPTLTAQVVVADLTPSNGDWHWIARIRARRPDLKVVVLVSAVGAELAAAIRADLLHGVIEKSERPRQARATIASVLAGSRVFPAGWQTLPEPSAPVAEDDLSDRERAIIELVADGLRNGEIAARLALAESTVKFHLRSAYAKLGARNRVEAVRAYSRARTPGASLVHGV